jgi:hypothetical protein
LRNLIDGLVDRLSEIRLPRVRPTLASVGALIGGLIERVSKITLPRLRPSLAIVGALIGGLIDRVGKITLPHNRPSWRTFRIVADDLPRRFWALRWRLRTSRLGRSADGIIVIPLLGVVLLLGVFTATAATRESSPSAGPDLPPTVTTGDVVSSEVVTQTITRNGETVRVIRYRRKPGRVVSETISGRSVTLPGGSVTVPGGSVTVRGAAVTLPGKTHTIVETETRTRTITDTVTTQEISTVTETQTATTTIVETVTEER